MVIKNMNLIKATIATVLLICLVFLAFLITKNVYRKYKSYIIKSEISEFLTDKQRHFSKFYVNDGYINGNAYIAHGGGTGEFTYSNCKEAIEDSIRKKFNFIEIDMLVTSDGKIVGAHDWKYFKKLLGIPNATNLSLSSMEIRNLKIQQKYTPIFGSEIYNIMLENDFILVTDKISDYKLLLKEIPLPERMVVEVFSPEGYLNALKSGIKYPAYCIWNLKNYKIAKEYKFPIVTMAAQAFFNDSDGIKLVEELHNDGITILLFGVNFKDKDSSDFIRKFLGRTVSKIYTDIFSPVLLP